MAEIIPDWRLKEIAAEEVNCLPSENGNWRWKCETCGKEWLEPLSDDPHYDRTKDESNWSVQCGECQYQS